MAKQTVNKKNLKVKFVSVEEGINALGFRRVAAVARKLNPNIDIYFITPGNLYSFLNHLLPSHKSMLTNKDINLIAKELAKADLLCFSSMTPSSSYVARIITAVKKYNPKTYIVWGGVHCIINPEEAIKHADAICIGEGEVPFEMFYSNYLINKKYTQTLNMWFRQGKRIIRNPIRPLNTKEELSLFPHLYHNYDCFIYDQKIKTFRNLNTSDFFRYNGLCYWTIWTLGCPYSCTYCANDAFIKIDNNYRNIRYSSVDYILDEIEENIKKNPFITTIMFNDDNFIALPLDVIKKFAKEYKKRINLPFAVSGLHPNLVTTQKMEILGKAGMNRGRMGIQSGSEKILAFYERPTSLKNIKQSVKILAKVTKKYNMIPPAYDIISDNPIATLDDILKSLKFIYELERPYTLTIFSLRIFPKTKLFDYFKKHPEIDIQALQSSYLETGKTLDNILLYSLAIFKPPKFIFFFLLKYVKGYEEKQKNYPTLYWAIKTLYLISRAIAHLERLDFSTITGPWGYYLWKLGIRHRKA
ncbi:MAG: radical SAM protein [Microgenomates group bacterium]|jgi:radical SAM superfamily enzyme YgiQ (UPF0313 family)